MSKIDRQVIGETVGHCVPDDADWLVLVRQDGKTHVITNEHDPAATVYMLVQAQLAALKAQVDADIIEQHETREQ